MFAVFATVLCLMSVSHSAPLACEDLVRHLDQLDPRLLEGRWALVAGSLKNAEVVDIIKRKDSIAIDFHNSTYTQADSFGGLCQYGEQSISLEGPIFDFKVNSFNITGTFFHTSCPDCVVFLLEVVSPVYSSTELYLFSRRREVEQKEMEEFNSQVECRKMPPSIVMDPTKELCPEKAISKPAAPTKETTEEQEV